MPGNFNETTESETEKSVGESFTGRYCGTIVGSCIAEPRIILIMTLIHGNVFKRFEFRKALYIEVQIFSHFVNMNL